MAPLDARAVPDSWQLGDIVTVPDGRSMSVRSVVVLPRTSGQLGTFAILGEMEMLLAASATPGLLHAYHPVDYLPPSSASAKVLAEGASAYWAPHLPACAGAMGEILYRVLALRSQVAPIVLVYRGPELIVFVPAGELRSSTVQSMAMPRSDSAPAAVARFAAVVDPLGVPLTSPVHAPAAPAPVRAPLPTLARQKR